MNGHSEQSSTSFQILLTSQALQPCWKSQDPIASANLVPLCGKRGREMELQINARKRWDTAQLANLIRFPLAVVAKYLTLCSYALKSHLNKKADTQYSSFCFAAPNEQTVLVWKGLAGTGRHKIHSFRNLDRKSSSRGSIKLSKGLADTSWPWIYLTCWASEAA